MENILNFLIGLKENNNREWFNEHKELYNFTKAEFEDICRMLILEIGKFDNQVHNLDVKDSVFRIYRDIRFSGDKTPYKSHFGAYFASSGRKSKYAGYYFHIEDNNSFISTGLHMPDPPVLKTVREEIFENFEDFYQIINNPDFKKIFPEIQGEKLKTIPKGFDRNTRSSEYLKLKSFYTVHPFTNKEVLNKKFTDKVLEMFETSLEYNNFFNRIIEQL